MGGGNIKYDPHCDFQHHKFKLYIFYTGVGHLQIEQPLDANILTVFSQSLEFMDKLQQLFDLARVLFTMEKLSQAQALTVKAQNFTKEGNHQYAIRCYDKIIILLRQSMSQATSKESIEAIKGKIIKYMNLKALSNAKLGQKEMIGTKIQKFGFPDRNTNNQTAVDLFNLKKNAEYNYKKPQNLPKKMSQSDNRKPLFQKYKQKVELDPSIQDLIIRKLDVSFNDIVGLKDVKTILQEAVIRPRQRPDLYTGIRAPPKGLLLYGPPGNGKTYICKALAKQSGCTFFALSASSILNKLVGQSEKMIKRVFQAAEQVAPSIIFIDEIDSMLTARSENENEASRRLKTEFLVLMDGINSPKSGDVLVIGATNLPKELDSAAKRRFSKLIYIGNPDSSGRKEMVMRNLKDIQYDLSNSDLNKIVDKLEYFSASEIRNIISEVCMIPLRQLKHSQFQKIQQNQLRKIKLSDFILVLSDRKPIVGKQQLAKYKQKI